MNKETVLPLIDGIPNSVHSKMNQQRTSSNVNAYTFPLKKNQLNAKKYYEGWMAPLCIPFMVS